MRYLPILMIKGWSYTQVRFRKRTLGLLVSTGGWGSLCMLYWGERRYIRSYLRNSAGTYHVLLPAPSSAVSIFASIHRCIRKHYFAPCLLWPSVRKELEVFRGLIFLQSDWWKPWNQFVSSSDSSLKGYRVSTAFWPLTGVRTCGRRLGRSRFRRPASTAARAHALTSAGFIRDELSQQWRLIDEELIEQTGWELSKDFEEIPGRLLHRNLWEPKLWGRWNFKSGIWELEGRALVKPLKRIALPAVFGSDICQLLLVDNMVVALSRSFALLKQRWWTVQATCSRGKQIAHPFVARCWLRGCAKAPVLERKRSTIKARRDLRLVPKKKAKSSSSKVLQKPDHRWSSWHPREDLRLPSIWWMYTFGYLYRSFKWEENEEPINVKFNQCYQRGRLLKKRRHRTSRRLVNELMEGKGLAF